jgi:outer membrane protein OmpA-like peptidoglycan-associated protein
VEPACSKVTPKTLAQEGMVSVRATDTSSGGFAAGGSTRAPAAGPSPQVIVTFALGSSGLTLDAKAQLKAALARYGSVERIMVAGRTDSSGSAAVNKALALARAAAVRDFLVKQQPALQGIVQVDAQGNCCFTASNDSQRGRSRNRRVEVTFWGEGA